MTGKLTFISAGAGSGKTTRLTEILHDRLTTGQVTPAGVLATTFTRKAAAELRERVRGHLLNRGRLELANAIGEARIGTVNSVCGALLERFAFEAGLSPDLRVLEEAEVKHLIREELEDAIDETTRKELTCAAVRMGREESWTDDIRRLIEHARANDIDPSQLAAFAERNAADLLSHFPKAAPGDLDAELAVAIRKTLPKFTAAASASSVQLTTKYLSTLKDFEQKLLQGRATWSDWLTLGAAAPEKKLRPLVEPITDLACQYERHPRLHGDIRTYLSLAFRIAGEVLDRYAQRKRELGALDFTDQELLLLHHLDNPGVADALRDELELLMVDEFQDTSPVQLALFMKLAGFAKETIWVGDVKQAIYGFRGSDTALMVSVIEALPKLGGKTEILGDSWRSRPALVKLVNKVFVPAFADTLGRSQVELSARRDELSDDPAFEVWTLPSGNIDVRTDALAAQLRRMVTSNLQVVDRATQQLRPVHFGDIAVLCRSNTRVGQVTSALVRQGVRSATAEAGLINTPESVLAIACLRRLNDPSDTVATAEILSLADGLEPEVWLTERLQYLKAGGAPAEWREQGADAHPLIVAIAALREQLPLLTPREALERVVGQCDLAGRVVAWCREEAEASKRLANLDALLGLAAKYEDACRATGRPGSLTGLLLWLDEQAVGKEDAQAEVSIDAVQVMTHHAAKGLEWPVVVLLDLDGEIKDRVWELSTLSDSTLDVNAPLQGRFIRFWPWPFGQKKKAAVAERVSAHPDIAPLRAAAHEEMKRLLYVSMTRARDQMIFALASNEWDDECWMGVTGASWLLDGTEPGGDVLPGKLGIPSMMREVPAAEDGAGSVSKPRPLYWFRPQAQAGRRLPMFIYPSAAEPRECRVVDVMNFGAGIVIKPGADPAHVGTAIHACLAASLGPDSQPLNIADAAALLKRYGVESAVDVSQLVDTAASLRTWIASRWPRANPVAEAPLVAVTPTGQILKGQLDLLIPLDAGYVVADHKTARGLGAAEAAAFGQFAGQLTQYGDALLRASPERRIEYLVLLPGAGRAVAIEVA